MKKRISILLLLVMVLTLLPMQAFAAEWPDAYNVTFRLQNGEVIYREENVPYVESVFAPRHLDIETWYCQALDMEVAAGEEVWCDFGADKEVVFVADAVLPESFTLHFVLPVGAHLDRGVRLDPENFMDFFTVPTVDGTNVTWTSKNVTLTGGQAISGQDLDLSYVWYEKEPVLYFSVANKPVEPDNFVVKFCNEDGRVISETVTDFWTFYSAIDIPEGSWKCGRTLQQISSGDYLSGDTLAIDFDWYGTTPEVVFYPN